jgi:hypothetical protein
MMEFIRYDFKLLNRQAQFVLELLIRIMTKVNGQLKIKDTILEVVEGKVEMEVQNKFMDLSY